MINFKDAMAYFTYLNKVMKMIWEDRTVIWDPTQFGALTAKYHEIFNSYAGSFEFVGWLLYFLVLIFSATIVIGLIVLLIAFIRKLVINTSKEKTLTENMRKEIARLNLELYDVLKGKGKIIGLEGNGDAGGSGTGDQEDDYKGVRFPRLDLIDKKYGGESLHVSLPEDCQGIDLKGICERFRDYACSQMNLYYTIEVVRAMFASMAASKLVILEGISGTGKTSMPYCMGRFFKHDACICAVQPSWRDRSELLGYYNDFTHKFTETEFLRGVYEATYTDSIAMIVLDEMNLARIEYYFAEFLSIMEMPNSSEWLISLASQPKDNDPLHFRSGDILLGKNIYFIGTANNDDSTFTITDKVYDRAMSIFFDDRGHEFKAPYTEPLTLPISYLENLFQQAKEDHPITKVTWEKFMDLDQFVIENFHIAFSNRILKQCHDFTPAYIAAGGTELQALDYIFCIKILKKFEVLNVAFLRDELNALDAHLTKLFGKNEFMMSRKKIKDLIKRTR